MTRDFILSDEYKNLQREKLHTEEGRREVGVWRWIGMYEYRHLLLKHLKGDILDIGGAAGPLGFGSKIVDEAETDILGNKVPYNNILDVDVQVDVIFVSHLLEHLENPFLFINRCWDRLKRGGKIIILSPSLYDLPNHPLINENHRWAVILNDRGARFDMTVGTHVIPLLWFMRPYFKPIFADYVGNTNILYIGKRKRRGKDLLKAYE